MAGICEQRVVIVTGAGRGIGREHALAFACEGAKVVVNDLGAEVDGSGASGGPAGEVVDVIRSAGGEAIGIYGNIGQTNYGAAKAGIAAFTVIAAKELARYGVTVNAIAPGALTRMTENLGAGRPARELSPDGFDSAHPANVAPLVVWLGSAQSAAITGRVFNVRGGHISVAEGWHAGPGVDKGSQWEPAELGAVIPDLVAKAAPNANTLGEIAAEA